MILMFMIAPIVLVNYIIIRIIMSIDEKKTWGAPQGHDRCPQKQNIVGYAAKTPIWRVKKDYKEQKQAFFIWTTQERARLITNVEWRCKADTRDATRHGLKYCFHNVIIRTDWFASLYDVTHFQVLCA